MHDVLYTLWFFVPAGFANAAPIIVAKLPWLNRWNTPLDFGHTYRGKRLFGDSKTWRGLSCAIVVGLLTFLVQQRLSGHLGSLSSYAGVRQYDQLPWMTGCLLGAGAIIGDALESFMKRQHGIAPGGSWFPFDQLDYIIGACLLVAPVVILPLKLYILLTVVWLGMHLLFSYLGYLLHLKKQPI